MYMYCSLAWLIVCCLSLFSIAYSSLCLGHISDRMGGMGGPMGVYDDYDTCDPISFLSCRSPAAACACYVHPS